MSVVIETTIGDITVDLFMQERPVTCLNFIKLCKLKYYNFNLFHNVEQGFIAQSGDPTGAGDGGSSVWGVVEEPLKRFFEAESLPKIRHTTPGLLSLVSVGKNMVGSQFFFTLGSDLTSLDGIHCVIGEVVEGHEILRKLNEAIVDEKFRPFQDIRITHTVVLDDPFPDPRGFRVPSRSPSPSAERMKNGRIGADEDIDDTGDKTVEEIQEMLADREAKARATILEIVGDLPDADMAPPENVLFVCKLNPVTTDDDLEIIFSRFGKVKGCEVIRDKKTGDSLQYAFVEFEEQKSCEAAYFKMDNVLIDDRRIHVDFSQSVAKVKWRGKGRGIEGHEGRLDFNNLKESDKNMKKERKSDDAIAIWREKERGRMTSEERVQARLERHRKREQEEKSRKSRSRSRSNQRYFDSRVRTEMRVHERERICKEDIHGKRPDSRSRNDDYDRKRVTDKRYSTEKQWCDNKHSPNRNHQGESTQGRTRKFPENSKSYKSILEKRITNDLKDKLQRKTESKTKSKKKMHTFSNVSSSVSSDSDSTSSERTSADTSTDSSSSEDNRKKKKKSKSKKQKKSKKSKKCKR